MEKSEEKVWKESFFQENFNVDQCLSKYTLKSDLETLRSALKSYGNELHQQMAEILKTETEAIVNLAEYLTNLSSKIDDLTLPISQLREEIKTLYDLIKTAEISYFSTLETVKSHSTKRNCLNLKSGILSSAMYIDKMLKTRETGLFEDSIVLERIVNKYSFEYNYLQEFGLASDIEEIHYVGRKLTEMVNKIFLNAIKNNESDVIVRSLRMYDNLGEQSEAEKSFQINIVRPALRNLFTESHLEKCDQNVNEIYNEALQFIDAKVSPLLEILERSGELKSFNFILNSFWVEVDKQSREGLPHITAPGNPELFQKRFKSTWNFLMQISEKCGNVNLIQTHESFQNHIKRFNLPVYFEIRFQQIAGQFETEAIIKPGNNIYLIGDNEINCTLKLTIALWKSLQRCFHSEVFIENLSDQFLKLSMLLLSRYLKWFELALEESDSFSEGPQIWEDFVIKSINDINIVNNLIGYKTDDLSYVEDTIYSILPTNIKPVLVKVFKLNTETITRMNCKLESHLITIKTNESLGYLQQVASIPRLYRRTNRTAPKEASHYMVEAIEPILKFSKKLDGKMERQLRQILDTAITNITKQYLLLVEEVLRSVCKTEESLRRLKNRNTQFSEAASDDAENSDTMSDEMKIREQIRLDVYYFIGKLQQLALEGGRSAIEELKRQTS